MHVSQVSACVVFCVLLHVVRHCAKVSVATINEITKLKNAWRSTFADHDHVPRKLLRLYIIVGKSRELLTFGFREKCPFPQQITCYQKQHIKKSHWSRINVQKKCCLPLVCALTLVQLSTFSSSFWDRIFLCTKNKHILWQCIISFWTGKASSIPTVQTTHFPQNKLASSKFIINGSKRALWNSE